MTSAPELPEQQAMLIPGIDAKILEDQHEDEYVITLSDFSRRCPVSASLPVWGVLGALVMRGVMIAWAPF